MFVEQPMALPMFTYKQQYAIFKRGILEIYSFKIALWVKCISQYTDIMYSPWGVEAYCPLLGWSLPAGAWVRSLVVLSLRHVLLFSLLNNTLVESDLIYSYCVWLFLAKGDTYFCSLTETTTMTGSLPHVETWYWHYTLSGPWPFAEPVTVFVM